MSCIRRLGHAMFAFLGALLLAATPASAQQKPNILFIMGDDIGIMQPSIYHRGLMVGETPNIDKIGQALWLRELETYIPFPPWQNPATYNLDQVMQQVRDMKNTSHAGE